MSLTQSGIPKSCSITKNKAFNKFKRPSSFSLKKTVLIIQLKYLQFFFLQFIAVMSTKINFHS